MDTTSLESSAAFLPSGKTHPVPTAAVIFTVVSALLFPPIIVLVITAAFIGHGEISWETVSAALQAAGTSELCQIGSPCP